MKFLEILKNKIEEIGYAHVYFTFNDTEKDEKPCVIIGYQSVEVIQPIGNKIKDLSLQIYDETIDEDFENEIIKVLSEIECDGIDGIVYEGVTYDIEDKDYVSNFSFKIYTV